MPTTLSASKPDRSGIKIHQGWFISFFLIIWSIEFKAFTPAYSCQTSDVSLFFWALIGAAGVFFSVLFHETGHILAEKAIGLPKSSRTLFLFGGVFTGKKTAEDHNMLISAAIAGPLASIILAAVFHLLFLAALCKKWETPIVTLCHNLTNINIFLTVINILPLPPFDGGAVLYTLLTVFKIKNPAEKMISINKIPVFLIAVLGANSISRGFIITGIWCFLLAICVAEASRDSTGCLQLRQFFKEAKAGSFLRKNPVTVQAGITLRQFVTSYMYRYHTGIFPVISHNQVQGFILTSSIKKTSKKYWNDYLVADFTIPCSEETTITSSANLLQTIKTMCAHSSGRLLVMDYGEISGVITLKDLFQCFQFRASTEDKLLT